MAYFVLMNFQDFLRENQVAFVKPTNNNNGLNFRNAEGQVVATFLTNEVPAEEDIIAWVKEHFSFTVVTSNGSNIIRLNKPVDKGLSLEGLWNKPAKGKKVKA